MSLSITTNDEHAISTVPGVENCGRFHPPLAPPIAGGESQTRSPGGRGKSEGDHGRFNKPGNFKGSDYTGFQSNCPIVNPEHPPCVDGLTGSRTCVMAPAVPHALRTHRSLRRPAGASQSQPYFHKDEMRRRPR